MPRPALTDEQRRETRRKIRAAAAALHAESGRTDLSARAVAERAGVSVGTLYSYFGSLSELMQSLWRQPARRLVEELEQICAKEPDPVSRLKSLLEAYAGFSEEQRSVFRGAFLFVRPESQEPPAQVSLDEDRFFGLFRQSIIDGQAAGSIRDGEPDRLTQTVLSAVHGAIALPINLHRLALDSSPGMQKAMIEVMLGWVQSPASSQTE